MAGLSLRTISKMIVNVENRIIGNQKVLESMLKVANDKLVVIDLKLDKLKDISARLTFLETKVNILMARIDDVIAAVAEETTIIASVGVLLDKLTALIAELREDLVEADGDTARVDELLEAVEANKDILRAAIIKNTPAEGTDPVGEHGLTM